MNIRANNGFFVCAEQGGGLDGRTRRDVLIANRAVAGIWETFQREPNEDGSFHLRTSGGFLVEAVNFGGGAITTTSREKTDLGRWRLGLDGSIVCPNGRHCWRVRTDLDQPYVDATGLIPGVTFRFE